MRSFAAFARCCKFLFAAERVVLGINYKVNLEWVGAARYRRIIGKAHRKDAYCTQARHKLNSNTHSPRAAVHYFAPQTVGISSCRFREKDNVRLKHLFEEFQLIWNYSRMLMFLVDCHASRKIID
jgi:hypothetical protein